MKKATLDRHKVRIVQVTQGLNMGIIIRSYLGMYDTVNCLQKILYSVFGGIIGKATFGQVKVVINLLIGQNNLAFYSIKIRFDISKIAKSGNKHREMRGIGKGRGV